MRTAIEITSLEEFYTIIETKFSNLTGKHTYDIHCISDKRKKGFNTKAFVDGFYITFNHSVIPENILSSMLNKYIRINDLLKLMDKLYPSLNRTSAINEILKDLEENPVSV